MNFCRDCRWLSDTSKNQPPSRWCCVQAVRATPDLVSGETPPYWPCYTVRRAQIDTEDCPLFEAGENCLNPKEVENAHV